MIANALDGNNKYTAAQISRKLKQLGLHIPQKKATNQSGQDNGEKEISASENKEQSSDGESSALKRRYTIC